MSLWNDHTKKNERDHTVALFDGLYEGHHRVVHAFLVGQVGDSERALDLLQETFVRVWKHIAEVEAIPDSQRRYWLMTLARNIATDYHRRNAVRKHLQLPLTEQENRVVDATYDPARVYSQNELQSLIDDAIRGLPVELRTPLTLHLLGEMTSAEIGAVLELPAGTVRYRISEARRRIAAKVGLGKQYSLQKGANSDKEKTYGA